MSGDICGICCGTGREISVDCPLTCEYLQEGHRHEKVPAVDPATFPHGDIRVTEQFIQQNEMLVGFAGSAVFEGALEQPGVMDLDVRAALEALVLTYRAREGGLVFDEQPASPIAAAIAAKVEARFEGVRRQEMEEHGGDSTLRDEAVLRVVAFLQRLEIMNNNGRPKSKAFLDFLGRFAIAPAESPIEQTVAQEAPLVIL